MPPLSDNPCKDQTTELPSSGLPVECKPITAQICCPKPVAKTPCSKCCEKKQTKGMKYIQPEVPASFKPCGMYRPPAYPFESGTVYSLSYPGVDGEMMKECKPKRTFMTDNIFPSKQPFSQDTTFRLSFTGVQGERPIAHKPLYRSMMGSGPMQSVTTHRHDYVPKVSERPVINKLQCNINLSSAKMEDATTMMLSYQPVEAEKVASYKPQSVYRKSEYKLEQDTINKLSYQPWEPMPKEEYPWMKKDKYKQPVYSMEGRTIYRASYLPVEKIERPASFKPCSSITTMGPSKPLSSSTIYKESYQDNGVLPRAERVIRRENLFLSKQPMSQDTTARLSYTGVGGERAIPYKPLYRNMMGAGPMQSITTHRHDYIPKPIVPAESCKPPTVLTSSNFKMEDTTTFRASYLPNDTLPKTESFKPVNVYRKSPYPLECNTINRLSYQAYTPLPKEEYPWMKKPRYQQSNWVMDGTSIYRGSYMAPGNFVPDDKSAPEEECTCQNAQSATDDL